VENESRGQKQYTENKKEIFLARELYLIYRPLIIPDTAVGVQNKLSIIVILEK